MSENKWVSKLRHLDWLAAFKATGVRLAGALALTAFAIYWDSLEPEALSQTDDMAGEPVVLVNTQISSGTRLESGQLTVVELPRQFWPPQALTPAQFHQAGQLIARRPLSSGQILTLHDVRPPRAAPQSGAQLWLPKSQVQGLGQLQESVRANLYAAGIELADAELTSEGDQWKIRVSPSDRSKLAQLSRGSVMAVQCHGEQCSPPLTPIKTLKPVEPNIRKPLPKPLQVSYGVEP